MNENGWSDTKLNRRRLLEAVHALDERGEPPYEALTPDAYRVRSAALVLPRDVVWNEGAAPALSSSPLYK